MPVRDRRADINIIAVLRPYPVDADDVLAEVQPHVERISQHLANIGLHHQDQRVPARDALRRPVRYRCGQLLDGGEAGIGPTAERDRDLFDPSGWYIGI